VVAFGVEIPDRRAFKGKIDLPATNAKRVKSHRKIVREVGDERTLGAPLSKGEIGGGRSTASEAVSIENNRARQREQDAGARR